jgi:hypothetical protein
MKNVLHPCNPSRLRVNCSSSALANTRPYTPCCRMELPLFCVGAGANKRRMLCAIADYNSYDPGGLNRCLMRT